MSGADMMCQFYVFMIDVEIVQKRRIKKNGSDLQLKQNIKKFKQLKKIKRHAGVGLVSFFTWC